MTYEAWNTGRLPDGSRIVAAADTLPTIPAIHLTRGADGVTAVAINVNGAWVNVIKDSGDIISHIVEPLGIERAIAAALAGDGSGQKQVSSMDADRGGERSDGVGEVQRG